MKYLKILSLFALAISIVSPVHAQTQDVCMSTFVPLTTPLIDRNTTTYIYQPKVGTSVTYQSGLYPNGNNILPPQHLNTGLTIAQNEIVPLNNQGIVDPTNGKIGFISIGMSNTSMEFGPFKSLADPHPAVNSKLFIFNTAISGAVADFWDAPSDTGWSMALSTLTNSNFDPRQVQVAWIKLAIAGPHNEDDHVNRLYRYLIGDGVVPGVLRSAKINFPNLKLVFFSSRTRSYTFDRGLNPEPHAFESAFSVRQTIENQITNPDGQLNLASAPFVSWGPYLWIDGTNSRSDGYTWTGNDMTSDCTHPSQSGQNKVAEQLMSFFMTSPLSTPWFLESQNTIPGVNISASAMNGSVPFSVTFTAATPVGTTVYWNFGDGTTAKGTSVNKIFKTTGSYRVVATITNTAGIADVRSLTISATPSGSCTDPVDRNCDTKTNMVDAVDLIVSTIENLKTLLSQYLL